MPSISLLVANRWRSRPATLLVPGHGIVTRPGMGNILITGHQFVANWLVNQGFCTLLQSEDSDESTEIDRQVYIDQDSHLQLLPPIESDAPPESDRLLFFFTNTEPAEINSAISVISIKKAQELKQIEPLQWSDVLRILSDRAIESAIKWAQT